MKPMYRILIVDDEENVRLMLETAFTLSGHQTLNARNGKEALRLFRESQPDVVLMDIRMPELNGLDALSRMQEINPKIPVVLMTAYAAVETAVEALRNGAFDYVIKPFDLDELNLVINRALQLQSMKEEIRELHQALSESWQWGHILTNTPCMMEICRDTARIALSNANVLISGESGTGKELIARAIHYHSRRASGPFIKINCAALPGLFERAHHGTLLLDEIGEMPLNLQVKLLRVLQEREFERVGGSQTIKVDIRILAATNRNLAESVARGAFREDLYYRLNVIHLEIPPLRQRVGDVPLLANHFAQKFAAENQRDIIEIDPQALALLNAWPWPGNVRELANVIERAVIMSTGAVIFAEDLPAPFQRETMMPEDPLINQPVEGGLKEAVKAYERQLLVAALARNGGNRTHTAIELAISRRALMYKLQEYGIE